MPTSAVLGVPVNRPEAVSNVAQAGMLVIPNWSESPSASVALGANM
jgi:hypothetical protein